MGRRIGTKRAWIVLAVALAVALSGGLAAVAFRDRGAARERFEPRSLPPEPSELAVSCLVFGTVEPPLDELALSDVEAIVTIVGRLVHAYQAGSFDSFLALRAGDFEFAEAVHGRDVEAVRGFCLELGLAPEEIPPGWIGALRAFWAAYYVEPPVLEFVPDAARVALHAREVPGGAESWRRSFEALYQRIPGATILHRLMVPHRRALDEVSTSAGELTWLDLELAFEARVPPSGRFVARFVWDPAALEWFLERAATVYEDDTGPDRRCLVF